MLKKLCPACKKTKKSAEFLRSTRHKSGLRSYCKSCEKIKLNSYRSKNRELNKDKAFKYEKTIDGFLVRCYRNMLSRVTGVQKKNIHLYLGLEILAKEFFYDWSKNDTNFQRLHRVWTLNNYNMKLTPSINRIDPRLGYTIENIEWMTHSQNSGLSSVTKHNKDKAVSAIYRTVGVKKCQIN